MAPTARNDVFGNLESSTSSPRTSDSNDSGNGSHTLIDILGGPASAFSNYMSSTASNVSTVEDTDSEDCNYDSAPESSGARLRFGETRSALGSVCSTRPPSRSTSPLPGSSAAKPSTSRALPESPSSSALHHHIHHHYHHTSRRALGSTGSAPDTNKDVIKEDSIADYIPNYFAAEHYRSSNLARKLGFFSSDASKRRKSAGRGWFGGSRRRDSNAEAPPTYSRSASYTRLGSANLDMSSSTTSLNSLLPATSTQNSPIRRRRYACDKADDCRSVILRQPFVPTQPLSILFTLVLLASFVFSITTYTKHALNNDKTPVLWRTFCQDQAPFPHDLADSLAPVNVFVGVFSVDAAYERRHLIRSTYVRHSKPIDPRTGRPASNVQVKFILGRPREAHARKVALEMETFGDVVVLDSKENMNKGKTHAFFNWANENATVPVYYKTKQDAVGLGFQKVDYVVKADDDAFLVLSELERHLRVSPRTKTYWGCECLYALVECS